MTPTTSLCMSMSFVIESSQWRHLRKCSLSSAFAEYRVGVSNTDSLPNLLRALPYILIGDDLFSLKISFMKSHLFRKQQRDERIISYSLSRASRVVENTFGKLSNRFRVYLTIIHIAPVKVEKLILASVVLHN